MKTIRQWVGGEYYEGSPLGVIPVENPATGEVTAELLQASKEDLDHTVEVARDAQKEWANYSLSKRVAIMFKMRQLVLDHQDEMARLIVEEHGKNYSDAIGEIQRGRETFDFATAINVALKGEYSHDVSTGVDIHTTRQPVGVVAGICPFNFPAMVPMWMHPLAVATGNAFILKPASPTPSASLPLLLEMPSFLSQHRLRRPLRSSPRSSTKRPGFPTASLTCFRGTAAVFRTSWFTRVSTLFRLLVRRQWLTLSKTPA